MAEHALRPDDVHRRRLHAQGLTEATAVDPVSVVDRLLGVQAQDPRGFRLAVRSRSRGLTAGDVDRCLTQDRSLVVDWLCRGTLHLVRSQDHAWLHALTTPPLRTANERRLRQEGVSPDDAERGVRVVDDALREDGPLPRDALRERLASAGVPTAGQALVHVLFAASLQGICLRGPVVDGEQAFAHTIDWLGPRAPIDREEALRELALRYLTGHGPASDRDLARWSGLPLRDVRVGLARLGSRVEDVGHGLLDLADRSARASPRRIPPPRLLGAFDPVLHGWTSRDSLIGPNGAGVVTSNGIFRPIALVGGRAVATWGLAGGRVTISPLAGEEFDHATTLLLDAEKLAVTAYLRERPPAAVRESSQEPDL